MSDFDEIWVLASKEHQKLYNRFQSFLLEKAKQPANKDFPNLRASNLNSLGSRNLKHVQEKLAHSSPDKATRKIQPTIAKFLTPLTNLHDNEELPQRLVKKTPKGDKDSASQAKVLDSLLESMKVDEKESKPIKQKRKQVVKNSKKDVQTSLDSGNGKDSDCDTKVVVDDSDKEVKDKPTSVKQQKAKKSVKSTRKQESKHNKAKTEAKAEVEAKRKPRTVNQKVIANLRTKKRVLSAC